MALGLTRAMGLTNVPGANQSPAGLVHTYDSGGQLPLPGVIIGNEDINASVAPDNDPADLGIDIAANIANGMGPQVDGQGLGAYLDLDTNTAGNEPFIAGIDDNDDGNGSDLAVNGQGGQTADEGFLAVHLSGIGENAVDGTGDVAHTGGHLDDSGLGNTGLLDFDDA